MNSPRPEKQNPRHPVQRERKWDMFTPWFITVASTLALLGLGIFLVNNILWFRQQAFPDGSVFSQNYSIHVHHIFLSMIKRSVTLFAGVGILFIGSATVFYTVSEQSKIKMENTGLSFYIATASPGLIAMLFGLTLLVVSTVSKDSFPGFQPAVNGKSLNVPDIP